MYNKKFWLDCSERAIYTMAETALGVLGGCAMLSEVRWEVVVSSTLLSGLVTVLKCIAVNKETK